MLISPPAMIAVPPGTIVLRDARTTTSRNVETQELSHRLHTCDLGTVRKCARYPSTGGSGRRSPVHSVSRLDAVEWCNALSAQAERSAAYVPDGDDVTWNVTADGFRLPSRPSGNGLAGRNHWPSLRRSLGHRLDGGRRTVGTATGRTQTGQCLRSLRHARQCLGMVLGLPDPARYAD